jgi:hypothetical protein
MTMQRRRQQAHREELFLLRNYVAGNLRQELNKEIEDLRQRDARRWRSQKRDFSGRQA